MKQGIRILKFNKVSFEYGHNNPILNEANFSIRKGLKMALMGQNGAGKSTIFQIIAKAIKPDSGAVSFDNKITVAIAEQVISRDKLDLTVHEFFKNCFKEKVYDIDPRIDEVLEIVNLVASKDKMIRSFSGGQQARLLLASAIIQKPDLLLLDEPTNNLDKDGIDHLTKFLIDYNKTCLVISHDSNFLNAFTNGVLYLDVFTHKIEQYVGNYLDLLIEISARIETENRKNAQLAKRIQENKDKANFFAHKGGNMRLVAKKMRKKAEEMEKEKVDVKKEDKAIKPFIIPYQKDVSGEILNITSFSVSIGDKSVQREVNISLRKGEHLLLTGRNGIGKTTLLESLASGEAKGSKIGPDVKIGYYRQDFSTLNLNDTVYESLSSVAEDLSEKNLRALAAGFLITSDLIYSKIGILVSFARLVIQKPGLLILDEPTNHINFRHLSVIASALDRYEGAMVLVSHVPEFVNQIRIDEILDLNK